MFFLFFYYSLIGEIKLEMFRVLFIMLWDVWDTKLIPKGSPALNMLQSNKFHQKTWRKYFIGFERKLKQNSFGGLVRRDRNNET
jgi:hypothetical protein